MNFNDHEEFAQHDFRHAIIEHVATGTRRDLILAISKLIWIKQVGHHSTPVQFRCGGVENLEECLTFLKIPCEIANLVVVSCKDNAAVLQMTDERSGTELLIRCRNFAFLDSQH